jgi:hypothetical protein
MSRRPTNLWLWLFPGADGEWAADLETSLFILALAFIAKYGFDTPYLTWLMIVASGFYFVRAIVRDLEDR